MKIKGETCEEQLKNAIKMINHYKYDSMTKLKGRIDFEEELEKAFLNWQINNDYFTLSIIDLNDLKKENDSHGHLAGDKIIRKLSNLLQSTFKNKNLFRIGGDEFAILCTNNHRKKIKLDLDKILNENKDLFCYGIVESNELLNNSTIADVFNFADHLLINEKLNHKEKLRG